MPQYLGTIAIMYNAGMFAEAGLADPTPHAAESTVDWDEFEAMAKKLTRDLDGDQVPDLWGFNKTMRTNRVYFWMKAAGAEFYGDEQRTVSTLNSPEAMAALQYLSDLRWQSQVMPPPGTSPNWAQGQVAMMEQGSWGLVNLLGRDVYDINVHVFTDAGPYAHPQLLYAQQDVANGLVNEAYTRMFATGSRWARCGLM